MRPRPPETPLNGGTATHKVKLQEILIGESEGNYG